MFPTAVLSEARDGLDALEERLAQVSVRSLRRSVRRFGPPSGRAGCAVSKLPHWRTKGAIYSLDPVHHEALLHLLVDHCEGLHPFCH